MGFIQFSQGVRNGGEVNARHRICTRSAKELAYRFQFASTGHLRLRLRTKIGTSGTRLLHQKYQNRQGQS